MEEPPTGENLIRRRDDLDDSAAVVLTRFGATHYVRHPRRASIELSYEATSGVPEPSPPAEHHRNWLEREDFSLPARRFGTRPDGGDVNLIDVVEEAVLTLADDGICVVSPVGSLAYARRDGELLWDLVRDLDMWCYVSSRTLAGGTVPELTARLQTALRRTLTGRGIRCESRPGSSNLFVRERSGPRRLLELKLADIAWLSEGMHHLEEKDLAPRPARRRPHAVRPRKEWAAYCSFENHYCSPAGEPVFRSQTSRITVEEQVRNTDATYRENYAVAVRALSPAKLVGAVATRRRFHRRVRKVLKAMLFLSVLQGDETLRLQILAELQWLRHDREAGARPSDRLAYLGGLVRALEELRAVDPQAFLRTPMVGA